MEVRILQTGDAAAFKSIRLAALRECPTAFSASYEEECDIALEQTAERLAPNQDRAVFGAFDGERTANAAAIALYESAGFEPFGVEHGFMLVDGVLHDELHMARFIARDEARFTPRR